MRIIACDFDGTLCENKFPQIGEPRKDILDKLKKEKSSGAKIILWTCREGDVLAEAIEWCKKFNIIFDAINENVEEVLSWMGASSRKIYATEYWDDRAVSISSLKTQRYNTL